MAFAAERPESFVTPRASTSSTCSPALALILKAVRVAATEAVGDRQVPQELDDARVVIAISQVVVERGEAVALAGGFHVREPLADEIRFIDVAPVVGRRIHREARRDGAVGADDDVVLACAAVPFAELHVTVFTPHDAGAGG